MTALRGEGMAKRSERLAKIKKGPGVFVYEGGAFDTEWIPTVMKTGRKQPVFDPAGFPVVDSSGRQIYERAGQPVRDHNGKPVLGGPPEMKKIPVDVLKIQGLELPKGTPVTVSNEALALKLRCMTLVKEVGADYVPVAEPAETESQDPEAMEDSASEPKRKPGRPKKIW